MKSQPQTKLGIGTAAGMMVMGLIYFMTLYGGLPGDLRGITVDRFRVWDYLDILLFLVYAAAIVLILSRKRIGLWLYLGASLLMVILSFVAPIFYPPLASAFFAAGLPGLGGLVLSYFVYRQRKALS